jgi:hypothetical protein
MWGGRHRGQAGDKEDSTGLGGAGAGWLRAEADVLRDLGGGQLEGTGRRRWQLVGVVKMPGHKGGGGRRQRVGAETVPCQCEPVAHQRGVGNGQRRAEAAQGLEEVTRAIFLSRAGQHDCVPRGPWRRNRCTSMNFSNSSRRTINLSVNRRMCCHIYSSVKQRI